MAEKPPSTVDQWLERETARIRKALENASRYFDSNDELTVNTLEAVYGQENSFGILMGQRGSTRAAGHFQFKPKTAKRYGLGVSKQNDQRFDIDRASSAAARYLKDLDLGAFNAGEGRVAVAQRLAEKAGKDPQSWSDVAEYLANETRRYVERISLYEVEFAKKSPADNSRKEKGVRKGKYRCTEGHWVTIDDRPVFVCD